MAIPPRPSRRRFDLGSVLARMQTALFTLAVLLTPALVHAQAADPPSPSLRKTAPVWVGYLVIFVLLAIVMAVSLMPSKRGHQD